MLNRSTFVALVITVALNPMLQVVASTNVATKNKKKQIKNLPINDSNGYLSYNYMTIEIASDICTNIQMCVAIKNIEKLV